MFGDTNSIELVGYALWLGRDLFVLVALMFSLLGLFSRRDRQTAAGAWIVGVLATFATALIEHQSTLLNLPDPVAIACLVIAAVLIKFSSRRAGRMPSSKQKTFGSPTPAYRQRNGLLTPAEYSFYQALRQAVGDRATICPKVGLWDIFDLEESPRRLAGKSRIDRKHVDFLLCKPSGMKAIVGIELDDSSHLRPDRKARDQFVDEVFRSADLPLLHVRAQGRYDAATIAPMLKPYLDHTTLTAPIPELPPARVQVTPDGQPLCPNCGAPMMLRVARRGQHQGKQFYACSNYPNCRSVLPQKS